MISFSSTIVYRCGGVLQDWAAAWRWLKTCKVNYMETIKEFFK